VLLVAVALALIAAGFEMTLPVFSQVIIDNVIGDHDEGLLFAPSAVSTSSARRSNEGEASHLDYRPEPADAL